MWKLSFSSHTIKLWHVLSNVSSWMPLASHSNPVREWWTPSFSSCDFSDWDHHRRLSAPIGSLEGCCEVLQLKHTKPSLNYSKVALMWFHTDLYSCGEELTRSKVIRFLTRGCPRLIPQHLSKQDEQHETMTPWKHRASDVIHHVERRRYIPPHFLASKHSRERGAWSAVCPPPPAYE